MGQKKKSVMVGMSGGVDSTVTALLLQQQGYDVVGVTFRLWAPDVEEGWEESGCCSIDNVRDAKMVCASLDIPHYVFNYKEKFLQKVVEPFVQEYEQGRTPNPCVQCNRYIKFQDFLYRARSMGFDYIATGHYAQIDTEPTNKRYRLRCATSQKKDQSYFLYHLRQSDLPYILMPLGTYEKPQVREIAREHGFAAGNKPDSQDICFIADGDYAGFLQQFCGNNAPKGHFVDIQGNILGEHTGIRNYTVGQRKGLGMTFGKPMFVQKILPDSNEIVLCEQQGLFATTLIANEINWIAFDTTPNAHPVMAKVRYAANPASAMVYAEGEDHVRVVFAEPQRALTPGQSVVFYKDDQVLGGATICNIL